MKKILIFISGIVVGIFLTISSFVIFTKITQKKQNQLPDGLTLFEKPGKCLTKEPIEVFQVLYTDMALANERSYSGIKMKNPYTGEVIGTTNDMYNGKVVAVINSNKEASYYDDQIIKPKTCFKHVGTYAYPTKDENWKTVPVVIAE